MMSEPLPPRNAVVSSRTDLGGTDMKRAGTELVIGSNIFRNTNGVVKIHGKEQLVLEYKPDQGLLLLTIDLYGEAGNHIAHVRRNTLALNEGGRFAIDVHRSSANASGDCPTVRLRDVPSDTVVFEAAAIAEHKVQISVGKFCSHKGTTVDITPHYCRIGTGMTLFGDIVDNRGRTVVLG